VTSLAAAWPVLGVLEPGQFVTAAAPRRPQPGRRWWQVGESGLKHRERAAHPIPIRSQQLSQRLDRPSGLERGRDASGDVPALGWTKRPALADELEHSVSLTTTATAVIGR
jgi:hypothetical protein